MYEQILTKLILGLQISTSAPNRYKPFLPLLCRHAWSLHRLHFVVNTESLDLGNYFFLRNESFTCPHRGMWQSLINPLTLSWVAGFGNPSVSTRKNGWAFSSLEFLGSVGPEPSNPFNSAGHQAVGMLQRDRCKVLLVDMGKCRKVLSIMPNHAQTGCFRMCGAVTT